MFPLAKTTGNSNQLMLFVYYHWEEKKKKKKPLWEGETREFLWRQFCRQFLGGSHLGHVTLKGWWVFRKTILSSFKFILFHILVDCKLLILTQIDEGIFPEHETRKNTFPQSPNRTQGNDSSLAFLTSKFLQVVTQKSVDWSLGKKQIKDKY